MRLPPSDCNIDSLSRARPAVAFRLHFGLGERYFRIARILPNDHLRPNSIFSIKLLLYSCNSNPEKTWKKCTIGGTVAVENYEVSSERVNINCHPHTYMHMVYEHITSVHTNVISNLFHSTNPSAQLIDIFVWITPKTTLTHMHQMRV